MAITNVEHDPRHAIAEDAKSKSGFGERLRTRLGVRAERTTPDQIVEHINAQSRWILGGVHAAVKPLAESLARQTQTAAPRPVQGELALYNIHPQPLLRRLAHLAIDLDADQSLGYRDCVARLHDLMEEFSAGARDEFKAQTQYEQRVGRNAVVAAAQGAVLEDAARRGEDIGPDSPHGRQAIGDLNGRSLHASDPAPTALQEPLTPQRLAQMDAERTAVLPVVAGREEIQAGLDSVPLAELAASTEIPPSPVHADGMAPPVPGAEGDEDADPGAHSPLARAPLPTRIPHPVVTGPVPPLAEHDAMRRALARAPFQARLEHGQIADGVRFEAKDLAELAEQGPIYLASAGRWEPVHSARVLGDQVNVALERGRTEVLHLAATVHVLSDEDAQRLLDSADGEAVR